jgi:hypothetical protein
VEESRTWGCHLSICNLCFKFMRFVFPMLCVFMLKRWRLVSLLKPAFCSFCMPFEGISSCQILLENILTEWGIWPKGCSGEGHEKEYQN